MIRKILPICLGVLAAVPACAADGPCDKAATQMELNACFGKATATADARLNALYKQLAAKSEGKEKTAFRDAQRAWIVYRDKECDYETVAEEGGSIRPMEISICVADKTKARIKEFEAFLACAPGDLSCTR